LSLPAYLRNHMAKLCQIFVHAVCDRGSIGRPLAALRYVYVLPVLWITSYFLHNRPVSPMVRHVVRDHTVILLHQAPYVFSSSTYVLAYSRCL